MTAKMQRFSFLKTSAFSHKLFFTFLSLISLEALSRQHDYSVNKKIQLDATVRRHLFTAKSLYMFRASLRPSSGVLRTVTATSGIGHNIGAPVSFQRGLIRTHWTCWKEAAAPIL
jgi:hypothetical protein